MDETLPDNRAITAPVPTVDVTAEVRNQGLEAGAISHFVVQYGIQKYVIPNANMLTFAKAFRQAVSVTHADYCRYSLRL